MNDQNQSIISAPDEEQTLKRKRGRPPKIRQSNESSDEEAQNDVKHDDHLLLGQTVSGVLNGTFDAGYFVTVKPQNRSSNNNLTLTGLIFCPEKVLPITPDNDLAPLEKMFQRTISSENAVPTTTSWASKSDMVECAAEQDDNDGAFTLKGNEQLSEEEQGYHEFQMLSYCTPNLQDYRIVDHDEILKEFEASACMNAPPPASLLHSPSKMVESTFCTENLINNESSSQTTELKLMDDTTTTTQTAASFDVNERPRPTAADHAVRSDLQLGIIAEAQYSTTSTKIYHHSSSSSSAQGLTTVVDQKRDKPSSEPPFFFFKLNDVNKKSVTESVSFTLGDSLKPNDGSTSEAVSHRTSNFQQPS